MKPVKVAVMLCLCCTNASADLYKYVAPNGQIQITNVPQKGLNYKILVRSPPKTYQRDLQFMPQNRPKYKDLISSAAERYQIDENLLHAVIQAESAYNAQAISSAGAVGLMQLMPDTAKRYGVVNRQDAEQNIEGGTRYLKDLLVMFNFDLDLAVAGYNAGEGAVMKYNYTVPPYPETRNYVQQVLKLYNQKMFGDS